MTKIMLQMENISTTTILVVEDSPEDYETIVDAFKRAGVKHSLYQAEDGEAGLAVLRGEDTELVKPCLVLLDLNLPGMDGREILAEIKSDPHLKTLPVVVLTTSSNPADIESCYQLGANSYQLKPIEVPAFRQVIQDIARYWLSTVVLPTTDGNGITNRWINI